MSTKVEVNQVAEILKREQVEPAKLRAVIEALNVLAAAKANAEDEAAPAVKKQFVILVSDPEGRFPKHDFAGWVLQIPEEAAAGSAEDRIFSAGDHFNLTKKGRLLPVKTVGEALEQTPAKILKAMGVWVKTRTPVLVLTTDNVLPPRGNFLNE